MKLRNLLSAVVLAGLGVSAMPAAASLELPPNYMPGQCRLVLVVGPAPLDVHDTGVWTGWISYRCSPVLSPGW